MVPDSNLDKAETRQADLVLSSLEEFWPQDFRLPAFPADVLVETAPLP